MTLVVLLYGLGLLLVVVEIFVPRNCGLLSALSATVSKWLSRSSSITL